MYRAILALTCFSVVKGHEVWAETAFKVIHATLEPK